MISLMLSTFGLFYIIFQKMPVPLVHLQKCTEKINFKSVSNHSLHLCFNQLEPMQSLCRDYEKDYLWTLYLLSQK